MIEPLLLACTRVSTFLGKTGLSVASGSFFERAGRLFLVTSRHVLIDQPTQHHPDRIELEFHADAQDLTRVAIWSLPLYRNGKSLWREGKDSGGDIDVAVIEIDRAALPADVVYACFSPAHLLGSLNGLDVGTPLLVVGFPLGFHDTVHHLPVVRHAVIASSFGVRFQGQGYFLTDARTHRGTSGAPVVMHHPAGDPGLPWRLLGVHSSRMDMSTRDKVLDESLGLNCAWYADILLTLTADAEPGKAASPVKA